MIFVAFSIQFSVAYGSDLASVREAGLKAAEDVPNYSDSAMI